MIIISIEVIIALIVMCICIFMMYRNIVVYNIRTKILELCSTNAKDIIFNTSDPSKWASAYKPYEALPSYEKMMWQWNMLTTKDYLERYGNET